MNQCFRILILLAIFAQPAHYSLAQEENLGMYKVYIWGEVKSPGAYQLATRPDIIELISTAGGPTQNADLTRVTVIKAMDGKVERINLKALVRANRRIDSSSGGLAQAVIFLTSGDVVLIPTNFWAKVKQDLPIITTLAIFANLALTIIQAQKE